MIIAIDNSPSKTSKKIIRAILSRYLWKVGNGVYAGAGASVVHLIETELTMVVAALSGYRSMVIKRDAGDQKGFIIINFTDKS